MKQGLVLSWLVVFALAIVLPAAAAGEEVKAPETKAAAEAKAPDGKALYSAKCAMCHGADGVAKPMAAGSANLNNPEWQSTATIETIEKVIAEGKNKMPKSKLTPEEIKAVAVYTKTLK